MPGDVSQFYFPFLVSLGMFSAILFEILFVNMGKKWRNPDP